MSGQSDRIPDVAVDDFYAADPAFSTLLAKHLDSGAMDWARSRLHRMGRLAAGEIDRLAFDADANPPRLDPYDRRGERTERIVFHPSYERMEQLAYQQEGIVADYYDPEVRRVLGRHTHRVKFAIGYIFAQAEQGLYCPVCMTDGAARLIEKFGSEELKRSMLTKLASKADGYWQGGMFLTEKQGGSDVGSCDTAARPGPGGSWLLTGDKWFCSNAKTDVAMVLARPEGAAAGTRGLGLFAMPRRLADGSINPYFVMRLKNKLGTRSMPTGETRLEGATAYLVGEPGQGFHYMTEMLNLSRLYNAVASIALTRRVVREAALYAGARHAFGRTLSSFPLVQETLTSLELELEGATALTFETVAALDAYDAGDATARATLRVLTPIAKLTTAKLAIRAASEAVEMLGGNGYVEDRVTARLFRDAQVLPVWEGTTNILVLDAFRALRKEGSMAVFPALQERLTRVKSALGPSAPWLERELTELAARGKELAGAEGEGWTLEAKPWCFRLASAMEAVLLAELPGERSKLAAQAFAARFIEGKASDAKELAHQFQALLG